MYNLVVGNMFTSALSTGAILLAIMVIVSAIFSTFVLSLGASRSADLAAQRLGADVIVLPPLTDKIQSYGYASATLNRAPASLTYLPLSSESKIANIPGIRAVTAQLYLGTIATTMPGTTPPDLIAFDPSTDFVILPWSNDQSAVKVKDGVAVAGYGSSYKVGDVVHWKGLGLNVIAVLEKSDTSLDRSVFIGLETAYHNGWADSNSGQVSAIFVRLNPNNPPEIVGRQVANRIVPSKVVVARDIERQVGAQISGLATFQLVEEAVVGAGFLIVVGFLFSMSANERRRQLGVIRALGGTRLIVAKVIVAEACLTAAIGTLLGVVVGTSLAFLGSDSLVHVFGIPAIRPSLLEILPVVAAFGVLGVGFGAAAAAGPAYLASRLEPYEAIRLGN